MIFYKLVKPALICACISGYGSVALRAQNNDTISLSLPQAEQRFLEQNLQLIAGRYGMQADSALILQARLWNNPNLSTDQNIYSGNRWFEHGSYPDGSPKGQYLVQLEFLIRTAGKRTKAIQLARTDAGISSWQFREMMLGLRAQLREDFFRLRQLQLNETLFNQQLEQMTRVIALMGKQLDAGNIARKDLLRLQALQLSLAQDATDNGRQLLDISAELKTLLQLPAAIYLKPLDDPGQSQAPVPALPQLLQLARQNNPAYRMQQLQLQRQQQYLSLQKANAVPDISLGPNYDHNSNYTPRYYGMGISLPLPVFNRNQGNIKAAGFQVKQEAANTAYAEQQLSNNVTGAWSKLQLVQQLDQGQQDSFYNDYGNLYEKITESYRQRQISLVEFIDYFDAYKDLRQRRAQQQLNLQLAREELSLLVGTPL